MKKIWILIVMLSLLLSACGGANNTAATPENNTSTNAADTATETNTEAAEAQAVDGTQTQGAPGQDELPEIAKVLLGTFLLENTDYAVTAEQASTLLPLWKGLNALQSSDTVTNEELEGLYAQIVSSMTEDQMDQIESLDITFESMNTVMESIGLGGRGGPGGPDGEMGDLTEEQIATMQAEREANGDQGFPGGGEGGGPGGGAPGGGDAGMMAGGGPGGEGGDAGMMAMQATDGESGFEMPEQAGDPSLMMMTRLFEPLIELLQSKIG